jgi:HD-GYP domain-containing protein (c-di-GMP phosphodiesterase class II)
MDIADLIQPRIQDRESLDEFADALTDQVPKLERVVAQLRREPRDRDLIATLFRALHTIKGDAAICKVAAGVMIAHPIESLLSRMRDGEFEFSDLLAEVVLLAVDRLELAVESLLGGRSMAPLRLPELVEGLASLSGKSPDVMDQAAVQLIESVTGFRPNVAHTNPFKSKPVATPGDHAADLQFFLSLALQFETRDPLFKGRTERLRRLAAETNAEAGNPVDVVQLEAAIYLHDLGMMFLPESVWLKVGKLSDDDKRQLRGHPMAAAALLQRIPGWDQAAEMVAQHHEMPDGGGYPQNLKGEAICAGAQILAIVDAFESITLKHSTRGESRSLLRAIAEINACDNQFSPDWIRHFNAVIRRTLET